MCESPFDFLLKKIKFGKLFNKTPIIGKLINIINIINILYIPSQSTIYNNKIILNKKKINNNIINIIIGDNINKVIFIIIFIFSLISLKY